MHSSALHSQECFLPLRGGFNLRCTQFTSQECPLPPLEGRALHTSPSHRISIYLLERYIPKNVFFLCEEVLIYDAPSLPRKDNRFDQELPSIRGSKVLRKGSRPVAWLDGMVEIDSLFRRLDEIALKLIPSLA